MAKGDDDRVPILVGGRTGGQGTSWFVPSSNYKELLTQVSQGYFFTRFGKQVVAIQRHALTTISRRGRAKIRLQRI